MTTLRVVEDAVDLDPDERVRLVARMLTRWHGITELELGRRLGLPRTSIYNRMQGRTPFTVAEVVAMGKIFKIAPEAFLAGPSALISSAPGSSIGHQGNRIPGVSRPVTESPYGRLRAVA